MPYSLVPLFADFKLILKGLVYTCPVYFQAANCNSTRLKVVCTSAGGRNAKHFCPLHMENFPKVSPLSMKPFSRSCGYKILVTDIHTYGQGVFIG